MGPGKATAGRPAARRGCSGGAGLARRSCRLCPRRRRARPGVPGTTKAPVAAVLTVGGAGERWDRAWREASRGPGACPPATRDRAGGRDPPGALGPAGGCANWGSRGKAQGGLGGVRGVPAGGGAGGCVGSTTGRAGGSGARSRRRPRELRGVFPGASCRAPSRKRGRAGREKRMRGGTAPPGERENGSAAVGCRACAAVRSGSLLPPGDQNLVLRVGCRACAP